MQFLRTWDEPLSCKYLKTVPRKVGGWPQGRVSTIWGSVSDLGSSEYHIPAHVATQCRIFDILSSTLSRNSICGKKDEKNKIYIYGLRHDHIYDLCFHGPLDEVSYNES